MRARSLLADTKVQRQRISALSAKELGPIGMRKELTGELWPFLEELCRCIMEDVIVPVAEMHGALEEQGDAIEALIDGEGDMIHQELATRILSVFEIGRIACGELEKLGANLDDIAKKRITEIIANYRKLSEVVEQEVQESIVDASEPVEQKPEPEEEKTESEAIGATVDAERTTEEG